MKKKVILTIYLLFIVLVNTSFVNAQPQELLSGKKDTAETQLRSDSIKELQQMQLSDDTTDNYSADTATLSDDDIIMIDEKQAEADSAVTDSIPPIDKMPELKIFIDAEYPERIYKQGLEGTVVLELLLNDSGTVDSVSVIKGIHPELDSSAARAARKFLFTPAVAGGKTVPVLIQYEYRFELKEVMNKIKEYVNFKGSLLESGTKKPIADAMVVLTFIDTLSDTSLPVPFSVYLQKIGTISGQYLEENRLVTITDSSGDFSFISLPACTVLVSAPISGYENLNEREYISPNEETAVTYFLNRVSYSDYEIVVLGRLKKKEVSRRHISLTEVKRVPGLGGDAVKVVQAMPGVARPVFGNGSIVVRGAPTWDTQFFLDGIPLPGLYHLGGFKSVYNSDALEAVDFYPGGFSTRYGNGIAGVVEITGRSAKTDRWHSILDISALDGSFLVEGPVSRKLSLMASARRSVIGNILKLAENSSAITMPFSLTPFYWDYLLRADYSVNKNNNFYLTLFGSRDSMTFVAPLIQGSSTEMTQALSQLGNKQMFHMGILGWDWKINDNCDNTLRYSFIYNNNKQPSSDTNYSSFHSIRNAIKNQLSFLLNKKSKINLGLDVDVCNYDMFLVRETGNNMLQKDTADNWIFGDIGAYINLEWEPIERLMITPGIRYDYYPELQYDGSIIPEFWDYNNSKLKKGISGEPSLRLTTRYEFIKKHTIKLSIGNYSQTPKPLGLVIHNTWGNPGIPATKAAHYVLGYEWQITDLFSSDIQVYTNRQWDIPRSAERHDIDMSNTKQNLWFDDEKGRMSGVEIMLRYDKSERFFGWLTYSQTERYNPVVGKWELYDDDETNNLQLVGSWYLKHNWILGLRARYITGKPLTPIIGSEEDENSNVIIPTYGEINSDRMGPFFQLDLRVDKKFIFDKWLLSIYLDIINSNYFVYKSPEIEVWNEFFDDKTTISNIFTPSLGLRAEF